MRCIHPQRYRAPRCAELPLEEKSAVLLFMPPRHQHPPSVPTPPTPTPPPKAELPLEEKSAFLRETRHAFGRTALILSGGGPMGAFHLVSVRVGGWVCGWGGGRCVS